MEKLTDSLFEAAKTMKMFVILLLALGIGKEDFMDFLNPCKP